METFELHRLGRTHHLQAHAIWTDTIRVPDHLKRAEMTAFHDLVKFIFWGQKEQSVFADLIPCLMTY